MLRVIDFVCVPPSELVTFNVTTFVPAESTRLNVRPVPMTPSMLLVQSIPASGTTPSQKSLPFPTKGTALAEGRVSPSPGCVMLAHGDCEVTSTESLPHVTVCTPGTGNVRLNDGPVPSGVLERFDVHSMPASASAVNVTL